MKHRPELLQLEDRLVPSTVVINPVNAPLIEGNAINLSATVTGNTGVVTGDWAVLKNGVPFASGAGTGADLSFSFTPDDNATYAVTLTVTDTPASGPAVVDTAGTSLTVINQPPAVSINGPATGSFGQPLNFTFNTSDVAPDVAAGFAYTVHWGDGTPDTMIAAMPGNSTVTVTHIFAAPGNNTFTVTATDKDGGAGSASQWVATTNGAAIFNRVLTVVGTNGPDGIFLVPIGKPTASNARIRVFLNGQDFAFSGVNSIVVYGLDGNDFIHLAGAIRVPAIVFGGAGDDRIFGGGGNDILVGGDGNDWIKAGQGNDIIIGGQGSDRLIGGPGDDLLIAGATTFDTDLTSLQTLRMEWLSSKVLANRVAAVTTNPATTVHLTTGLGGTLVDDGAMNRLTAAAGRDAFFATVGSDIITDIHPFDFLNGVIGVFRRHGR
jgi:Ca2+-binding RTX toxin-like protein